MRQPSGSSSENDGYARLNSRHCSLVPGVYFEEAFKKWHSVDEVPWSALSLDLRNFEVLMATMKLCLPTNAPEHAGAGGRSRKPREVDHQKCLRLSP
jgi:hypothetical protein